MNLAAAIFGTAPGIRPRLLHAAVVVFLAFAAVTVTLMFLIWLWPAWLALAVVLLTAYRIHPGVRWTWLFMPPRRRFTLLVMVVGLLARPGIEQTFNWVAGLTEATAGLVGIVCLALSACGAWYITRVFECQAMTEVFKPVTPTSRGALLEKLRARRAPSPAKGGNTQQDNRTPAQRYPARRVKRKLSDLYGNQLLKGRLHEAVLAWREKGKNGVLLHGPAGTGKTSFAEGLAGELDLPIIEVNVGNLASKWVGAATENLASLFDSAADQAPCVLFLDEVEAILEDRAKGGDDWVSRESGHNVATFLARATAMRHSQVLLIAATNFIDRLDAAAVREGRFDFKVEVPLPDDAARRGLVAARLAKAGCSTDPDTLARLSKRWSGFNIPRIIAVTDAASEAVNARTGAGGAVAYTDFYSALRRIQGAKAGAPEGAKKFADLILEPGQESRLREIADQLTHTDEIEQAGGTIPKGILFFGPPGTGKTATAMALAKECGWSFVQRTGRALLERGAIEKLREDASDMRPAIVFLDEADDILADRQMSQYKSVTNELLVLIDGAGGMLPDVVWIAATNHAGSIDEAALRAGRFEQKVEFGPPTKPTARRMVLSWATAHADRLDRTVGAWADAVLPYFAGLTAANVFGALGIANNLAVARVRKARRGAPIVTPEHVKEAVRELAGVTA